MIGKLQQAPETDKSLDLLDELDQLLASAHDELSEAEKSSARRAAVAVELRAARIMVVDDEPLNSKAVIKYLRQAGYDNFAQSADPGDVLRTMQQFRPDLMLLDLVMPGISGIEILRSVANNEELARTPIIILTAVDDRRVKAEALNLGAADFLTKPVDASELTARVRNVLSVKRYHDHLRTYAEELENQVARRTSELEASRLEVIHCLARAAEYRDNETGQHVIRVARYVGIIARQMGLDDNLVRLLEQAAPLHDMGKIGIPDSILLKPGKLTDDERAIMQRHCVYGSKIAGNLSGTDWKTFERHSGNGGRDIETSPILKLAASISLTHHEKWDGSGYPMGLAGEDIPIEGRITAVADVFDALCSKRPYKPSFPLDKCLTIMEEGRGRHFDPKVLDAFFAARAEIIRVKIECGDAE
jgi:putative two-component system response regulator